jgi:3-dehydro-4-phosphotetronate decarboxylase
MKMNEAARPTDHEIEAAARVLFEEGRLHHWWPTITKSYDEFAAADPIGLSEFGGIVERILLAASRARLKTETPGPS